MKFFNWLLGKDWNNPEAKEASTPTPKMQRISLHPVPKWTHAAKKGQSINCPHCRQSIHVYNFAWSALICPTCKVVTNKYLWLIEKDV